MGAGPGMTNWIGVLPIFDRPNKVQLSIGAAKVIWVPCGSLRRLSAGSSINAEQVLLGETTIIALSTLPSRCTVYTVCCVLGVGVGVGVCPSICWYRLLIPIIDDATKSTIIDTEVFLNMVLDLSCSIKRYND